MMDKSKIADVGTSTTRFKRGQIWMFEETKLIREPGIQSGTRPYLIISNDFGNIHSPFITCLACTSKTEKARLITNVLYKSTVSNIPSVILCNQVRNISKTDMEKHGEYWETVSEETMAEVEKTYMYTMGIPVQESVDLSAIENIILKITENKMAEYNKTNEVTEDMIIKIAAGLEKIFSDVLHKDHSTSSSISINDITPELLEFHNACQNKSSKSDDQVGTQISNDTTDETTFNSPRKARGFWTDEAMQEYIHDYQEMSTEDLVNKWEITKDRARSLYYANRKRLKKKGIEYES